MKVWADDSLLVTLVCFTHFVTNLETWQNNSQQDHALVYNNNLKKNSICSGSPSTWSQIFFHCTLFCYSFVQRRPHMEKMLQSNNGSLQETYNNLRFSAKPDSMWKTIAVMETPVSSNPCTASYEDRFLQ